MARRLAAGEAIQDLAKSDKVSSIPKLPDLGAARGVGTGRCGWLS
jgi:hypothetical protein